MKKVLLKFVCAGLALIIFSYQAVAYTSVAAISAADISTVSNFDENEIYNAFSDVDELVSFVQDNDDVTLSDLEAANSNLISNVAATSSLAFASSDTPPIFSAFIWGCLLNWVGMLIVGLTTGFDGDQITKSLWGCLINSCIFGGGYGWWYYYY